MPREGFYSRSRDSPEQYLSVCSQLPPFDVWRDNIMIIAEPSILGIMRYGSLARGDADQHSDNDMCIIVSEVSISGELAIRKARWASELGTTADCLSVYTASAARHMAEIGALFL